MAENPLMVRKPHSHRIRMMHEAVGRAIFDRNIRKEREIGVHPKYLDSYRRRWAPSVSEWEIASKAWDEANPLVTPS